MFDFDVVTSNVFSGLLLYIVFGTWLHLSLEGAQERASW
jgi:hypothetical protein